MLKWRANLLNMGRQPDNPTSAGIAGAEPQSFMPTSSGLARPPYKSPNKLQIVEVLKWTLNLVRTP